MDTVENICATVLEVAGAGIFIVVVLASMLSLLWGMLQDVPYLWRKQHKVNRLFRHLWPR